MLKGKCIAFTRRTWDGVYKLPGLQGLIFIFNYLSWGMAGTLIAGPITDGLLLLGKSETYAYMASFNASALVTLAGVMVVFALFYMEKEQREPR